MPEFAYTAFDDSGRRVSGVLAGATEQAVLSELEGRRLTPVAVGVKSARVSVRWRRGVSTRQLATAYTQIADLLRAGVPLLRALRLIGQRRSAPALAAVFRTLADAVAEGTDLARAMEAEPETFTAVHVAMVRAGERGGFLEPALARLGQLLLGQAELRSRIVGSMIYPAILMVFGTVVMGLIFGLLIPVFRPVFDKMTLNPLTASVLSVSGFVSRYGLIVLGAAALGAVGVFRASRHPRHARRMAMLKVKLPVVGSLSGAMAIARFCRILGTLLANHVPVIMALGISREAAGNLVLEESIDRAIEAVRHGEPLHAPLAASGLFPDEIVEMLSVGESANNLDQVLLTVADTVEARADRLVSAGVKLIEPLMLIALGLVVGLVALALLLPMSNLAQSVS
ncbi:MAG: type II secretion system F family protein [Phycisphaerae bacterium]|nr:type II secretion system F family protein [Phycisphaerae bacterium]